MEREFDIVVYGASGFVGRQAACYLGARAASAGLRIAIAGRDRAKLEAVRAESGAGIADVLCADAHDREAIDAIAARTRVVLTTAGPFATHGNALVDACVRFRTHYVDITGESPWMRDLIDRHHERAVAEGTRIVPACGFDCVPSDIGAFLVARFFRDVLDVPCGDVRAYFELSGGLNGGTAASMLALAETPGQMARMREPFLLDPADTHDAAERARNRDPRSVRFDPIPAAWTGPFLMGPVNTRVVRRSAALFASWGEAYGPAFTYQEYMRFGGTQARLKALAVTTVLGLFEAAVQRRSTRTIIARLAPKPGAGPSEATIRRARFRCELVGMDARGPQVRVVIADRGDPSNAVTVKCVCESALALAIDLERLPGGPERGGVLTPATAFGDVLVERLRAAGMHLSAPTAVQN